MSYLTLDADRLVREAVDTYLDDRMRPDSGGDCVYATRNSQYRVVEGTVQEASDVTLVGAELVGWLLEELGQPMIEPRWRAYARAVFVERRSRQVVVTSRTLTRTAISGDVPPPGKHRRRTPSVIPNSPPIPVLKTNAAPADGSPTPFRVPDAVRESARAISANERPTTRPPPPAPEEQTVSADRGSYDNLVEQSRTPTWSAVMPQADSPTAQAQFAPQALAPHSASTDDEPKSVRLPPVNPPPRRTPVPPMAPPRPAAGTPAPPPRSTLDEKTEETATELGQDDLEDDHG
jgi:hypothetical protein